MAIRFEKVSRFADIDFAMPERKTANSAGYDMVVAEDIIVQPWSYHLTELAKAFPKPLEGFTLDEIANITKSTKAKPTLVSTGVKCYLEPGTYLELSVRSSTPLKYWLILANGVGIIDADYADNPDNEGEIFLQLINLSPYPIALKKGDVIGQGIIKKYGVTDNDNCRRAERIGGFGSTSNQLASPGQARLQDILAKSQTMDYPITTFDLSNALQDLDLLNNIHEKLYEQMRLY